MCVDELRWFVRGRRRAIIDLQMNWSEIVVRVILVPAYQQTSFWLDPVEPVVLVRFPRLQLKANLDSRGRHRVLVVTGGLAWVYLSDDPVWTRFARFRTPLANVLEFTTESILDAVVEPLALQIRSVSEENDH